MKHFNLGPYTSFAARCLAMALGLTLLSACSILQEDKVDYRTAQRGNDLEVPPDLTQLSRESRYALPSGVVSASSMDNGAGAPLIAGMAPNSIGTIRIERAGSQRWLVTQLPADQLWQPLKDFWKANGFEMTRSEEALGIMETDWAENRANLPKDFIRRTIGQLFEGLYSTGERDRYRTRLERREDGGTDIFISHNGMQEVYTDRSQQQTAWQPRAADPELEAEFLRRVMLGLGVPQAEANTAIEQAIPVSTARLVQNPDSLWVEMGDGFDRAWRRVGLALDRTGFTVEDRNRSEGTYLVRFVPTAEAEKSSGIFNGWGSSKPDILPVRYQMVVRTEGNMTQLRLQNEQGQPINDGNALQILTLVVDDLK